MLAPVKKRSHGRLVAGATAAVLAAAVGGCGSEESAVDAPNDSGAGVTFPLEALNDSELEGATVVVTPLGSDRARIEVDGIVEGSPYGGGPHRVELLRGAVATTQGIAPPILAQSRMKRAAGRSSSAWRG